MTLLSKPQVIIWSLISVKVPQNKNAVSTAKWNIGTSGNYKKNVCFDFMSSRAPYSNWTAIDYTNSTDKANYEDRVLRQAVIRVWKGTTFAEPVTLTTTVTDCYIYPQTITAGGPYVDFYTEFMVIHEQFHLQPLLGQVQV